MKGRRIIILLLVIQIIIYFIKSQEIQEDINQNKITGNEENIIQDYQQQEKQSESEAINNQKNEEIQINNDNIENIKQEKPIKQIEELETTKEEIIIPNGSQQEVIKKEKNEEQESILIDQIKEEIQNTSSVLDEKSEQVTLNSQQETANLINEVQNDNNETKSSDTEYNNNQYKEISFNDEKHSMPTNHNNEEGIENVEKQSKPTKEIWIKSIKIIETFLIKISQDVLVYIPYPFDLVLYSLFGYLFVSLFFSSPSHIQLKKKNINPDQNIQLIEKKLKEMTYNIQKKKKSQLKKNTPDNDMLIIDEPASYVNVLSELDSKATTVNEQFKNSINNHKKASEDLSHFLYDILTKLLNKNSK